jgi:hypothetical protein
MAPGQVTQQQNADEQHPTESQPLLVSQRSTTESFEGDVKGLKKNDSVMDDVYDILRLGFPIFLSSLSWVGVSITCQVKPISLTLTSAAFVH